MPVQYTVPAADKDRETTSEVGELALTLAWIILGAGTLSTNSPDNIRIEEVDDDIKCVEEAWEHTDLAQGAMKYEPSGISHGDAGGD